MIDRPSNNNNNEILTHNLPLDLFLQIFSYAILLGAEDTSIILVSKWWSTMYSLYCAHLPALLVTELQQYFTLPKDECEPLSWHPQLYRSLPMERSYLLSNLINDKQFQLLKNLVRDKNIPKIEKMNNPHDYSTVSYSKPEIKRIVTIIKSKRTKQEDHELMNDLLKYKLSNPLIKENVLNILLYAILHKKQTRTLLRLLKISLNKNELRYNKYDNPDLILKDEDVPKILYDMLTLNKFTLAHLNVFRQASAHVSQSHIAISELRVFYHHLELTASQQCKSKQTRFLKQQAKELYLHLPNFVIDKNDEGYNLSYADLPGLTIQGKYFSNFNCSYANLRQSSFRSHQTYVSYSNIKISQNKYANFKLFNFTHADLAYSTFDCLFITNSLFQHANLLKAAITHADLVECDFSYANLRKTNWTKTRTRKCNFKGAYLDGSFNEIVKIRLDQFQPYLPYTNDWIYFLKKTDDNSNLTVDNLNYAILLPLRAALNLPVFDFQEKRVINKIIKKIENFPFLTMSSIFTNTLATEHCFSDRIISLLGCLYENSIQYDQSTYINCWDINAFKTNYENKISLARKNSAALLPSNSADQLAAKAIIQAYFSSPITGPKNKLFKFNKIMAFLETHPHVEKDDPDIEALSLNILKYAIYHPVHIQYCLHLLKAFISKESLSFQHYMSEDQIIRNEDIAKIIYDALTIKNITPIKAAFFIRTFSLLVDNSPTKTNVFKQYIHFYTKVHMENGKSKLARKRKNYTPSDIHYPNSIFKENTREGLPLLHVPPIKIAGTIVNKNFRHANLRRVKFLNEIENVSFYKADLRDTFWKNTSWLNCNFRGANFNGAQNDLLKVYLNEDLQCHVVFMQPKSVLNAYMINHHFILPIQALASHPSIPKVDKKHLINLIRMIKENPNTDFQAHCRTLQQQYVLSSVTWTLISQLLTCPAINGQQQTIGVALMNADLSNVNFTGTVFSIYSFHGQSLRGINTRLFSISNEPVHYIEPSKSNYAYLKFNSDVQNVSLQEHNSTMLLAVWHVYLEMHQPNELLPFILYFQQVMKETAFHHAVTDYEQLNPIEYPQVNTVLSYLSAQSSRFLNDPRDELIDCDSDLTQEDETEDQVEEEEDQNDETDDQEASDDLIQENAQIQYTPTSSLGIFGRVGRTPKFYTQQAIDDYNVNSNQQLSGKKRKSLEEDLFDDTQHDADAEMDVDVEPVQKKQKR